jgi:hypothetical protein
VVIVLCRSYIITEFFVLVQQPDPKIFPGDDIIARRDCLVDSPVAVVETTGEEREAAFGIDLVRERITISSPDFSRPLHSTISIIIRRG